MTKVEKVEEEVETVSDIMLRYQSWDRDSLIVQIALLTRQTQLYRKNLKLLVKIFEHNEELSEQEETEIFDQ